MALSQDQGEKILEQAARGLLFENNNIGRRITGDGAVVVYDLDDPPVWLPTDEDE